MKKTLLTITFVTFLICLTAGATGSRVEYPGQGDSLGRMIDSLVSIQHQPGEPGGVIAVISDGKVLHKGCYGLMNLEQGLVIDETTLFDIASVSKQFTAYAILMLENEGRLNLDDDISEILPWLPAYAHKVTIRHLLQHTSGIASTDVLRLIAGIPLDKKWTQHDEISLIKQYPYLNFEPNTRFLYSNAGYALLANIVEQVSGMDFPAYMDSMVFDRQGMTASLVMVEAHDDPEAYAVGYKRSNDDFEVFSSHDDFCYGSGNIFSSLNDMITWGTNIVNPGIGYKGFLQRISTTYNTLNNGDTLNYTYGFYVRKYKGMTMVEHSGGVPGFRNQFMIFPEENTIILLMFNNESINTRNLATGIADIHFASKLVEEAPKVRMAIDVVMHEVKPFEGSYLMDDGMELTFVAEPDTCWLLLPGDNRFQLFAETRNKFFLKAFDAQCTFVQQEDGTVNEMVWHQGGQDYVAVRVDGKVSLDDEELPAYAGIYQQKDLRVRYPVTLDEDRLTLHLPDTFHKYLGLERAGLTHMNGDKFYTDRLGVLEFTRDEDHQINGFILLNLGRIQHIRFSLTTD